MRYSIDHIIYLYMIFISDTPSLFVYCFYSYKSRVYLRLISIAKCRALKNGNTPLYGLNSVPPITMIEQKKFHKFRASYEDVDLKKVIIIFLNLATYAFSTSVFQIMCKSSQGFNFIGSLYKMKKYKRIKKYFHFTTHGQTPIN